MNDYNVIRRPVGYRKVEWVVVGPDGYERDGFTTLGSARLHADRMNAGVGEPIEPVMIEDDDSPEVLSLDDHPEIVEAIRRNRRRWFKRKSKS